MVCSFQPYEGREPYIFASYSHRDSELVGKILDYLDSQGYRIWFDGGIEWGSEWPESIAEHLDGCAVCLPFLSRSFVESPNCRQEIFYALKQRKGILSVYLEEASLSKGMDMQLSSYQQTSLSQYSSVEQFCRRLAETPLLQECRQEKPPAPPAEPPVPPERPAPTSDRPEKGGGLRKRLPLVLCACAAVALIAAGAWFLGGRGGGTPADGGAGTGLEEQQPEDQTPEDQQPEDQTPPADGTGEEEAAPVQYHIRLEGGDMSVKEFNEAVEILRGRLDTFIADTDYTYELSVFEDKVDVVAPREMFGAGEIGQVLEVYFSRPVAIYGTNKEDISQYVPISREDLAEVTLKTGPIEGIDPADVGFEEEGTYDYIEVVLTDACAQRISEEVEAWGDDFVFIQDLEGDPTYWWSTTCQAGDGKTFWLPRKAGSRFGTLMTYNLTHPCLPGAFRYTVLWNDVVWEPADGGEAGENQCEGDAFTEGTVTIAYKPSQDTPLTAGERMDFETAMRNRLDALGQPYALGHREEEPDTLYVKTGLDHMGTDIMGCLRVSGSYLHLRMGLTEEMYSTESREMVETENGGRGLRLVVASYDWSDLAKQTALSLEKHGGEVLMVLNDVALAGGTASAVPEDGAVLLDRLPFLDGAAVTEENAWVLELAQAILTPPNLPVTVSMSGYQFNAGADGTIPDEDDLGVVNQEARRQAEELRTAVKALRPEADVEISYPYAYVHMYLPADDTLAERGAQLVKDLYEGYDLVGSGFKGLTIYLDEENGLWDGARIIFQKMLASVYTGEDGYVYVQGWFSGSHLEPYRDQLRKAFENDPFFEEFNSREYTAWHYERE